MITATAKATEAVTKRAYLALYHSQTPVSDPLILKEDAAVLTINHENAPNPHFKVENHHYTYTFNLEAYFPSVSRERIMEESQYWTKALYKTKVKQKVINHLKKNKHSRRALISLWKPSHFKNLERSGACITQLYFRVKKGCLEFHTHARANDAHNCLLMDLHMMTTIHAWVADNLNLKVGKHIHFVDALHFYKKDKKSITKQIRLFDRLTGWKKIS